MIFSLPNIYKPEGLVFRRFFVEFYAREDVRSTEEGVGIDSYPQISHEGITEMDEPHGLTTNIYILQRRDGF